MKTLLYQKSTGLLLLLLLLRAGITQAQNPAANSPYSRVAIASPTAASLGKYTDIPVNYHTGIPEISIPLYTIKEGSLSLPLSLTYHGSGMQVMEPASWVGAGWALQAGGVITRAVLGGPDENGSTNERYGHFSDYGYSSYLTDGSSFGNSNTGFIPAPNDTYFAHAIYDGEPDVYSFNFNGYAGKFYFSDDRTPVLVNGDDLKIEYYYPRDASSTITSLSANIQGFIITVPTGDKYYFGTTDNGARTGANPVEMTFPYSEDNNVVTGTVFSSYYLSKIVAADGLHTINFTYTAEKYSYYTVSMFPISPGLNSTSGVNPKEYRLVKNNMDGIRLAQISFSNGTVTLQPSGTARTDLGSYLNGEGMDDVVNTQAMPLGTLAIAGPGLCKQFAFSYSYFTGDNTALATGLRTSTAIQTDKSRLKLDAIQEKSCDGTLAANPWVFDYQKDATNHYFLPRRLSFAQDHWGFYNGRDNNNSLNTLIPTYTVGNQSTFAFTTAPGADRDAAWPAMGLGTLTKITYPTGGTSTFAFEPNDTWVDYTKYSFHPVAVQGGTVGPGAGQSSPHSFTQTFSANPYHFILDFSPSYPAADGHTTFVNDPNSTPFISLTAGTDDTAFNRVRSEETIYPGAGTQNCSLSLSYTNYNSGTMPLASLSLEEGVAERIQQNVFAGGLRIKTQTTKESATASGLVTNYAYLATNGRSTGNLYGRPRYAQVIRNDIVAQYGFSSTGTITNQHPEIHGCMNPDTAPSMSYLVSPCGLLPLATTQGNHIGYDQVTVAKPGNGRTDYYYDGAKRWISQADVCYRNVNPTVCDPIATPNQPTVPLPFDFSRGQLKQEMVFDEAGTYLKNVQYTCLYDSSKTVTPAYLVKEVGTAMLGSFYERKSYWKKQLTVLENNFAAGSTLQTTKVYQYASPYHRQLTQLTETASSGDVLVTTNKYALDVRVAASDNLDNGLATYASACATCESTRNSQFTNCPTVGCFGGYVNYVVCRANARKAYIAYRRANFTNRPNNFQAAHDAAKGNADGLLRPLLQLQDDYTNSLVEASRWKNGQLLSASYTVFGPGVSQPSPMYPAKVFSLPLSSPAATFTPVAISGNTLSTDPRYSTTPETSLKFDQGNLVELLPRTGIINSYIWGYTNTLPIASATGVAYATLSAAYNSAGGNLTTLRATPSLAKSLLATYTYQPLVGLTNQTDPTGRTTAYEYDALGRLVRTRDEQQRILSQQQYHYAGQ